VRVPQGGLDFSMAENFLDDWERNTSHD